MRRPWTRAEWQVPLSLQQQKHFNGVGAAFREAALSHQRPLSPNDHSAQGEFHEHTELGAASHRMTSLGLHPLLKLSLIYCALTAEFQVDIKLFCSIDTL